MVESNQTHEKIISILKEKGPSLPIQIAKEAAMSSLFISAFLSELTNSKRIKVSNLKVGGSPLYFLDKQEEQLEPYYKYLHPKEAEAFVLLKKQKILKDSEQEPAIRVALRSIRDFSIGFKKNEEIYWKYFLLPESDVNEILSPKTIKPKQITKQPASKTPSKPIHSTPKPQTPSQPTQILSKEAITQKNEFQNPLVEKDKPKKDKPKSEFILKTIAFIEKNNLKIIEEKEFKAKEYNCVTNVKSQLGDINFLTQAKDKKSVSETDLKKLLSESQKIPIPAFFIYTGKLSKKAEEYAQNYASILKTIKIL